MGRTGRFLRKVRANFSDRPTGFIWVEPDRVAASGLPSSRNQLRWLSRRGISSVLTLTEDPISSSWSDGLPLTMTHIPMKDHEPPSLDSLERAAAFVQGEVHAGKKVLVHCLAGQGRTMCVLAAYLMKEKGIGPEEALRTLRALRPGAVEQRQEGAVFDFAKATGSPS